MFLSVCMCPPYVYPSVCMSPPCVCPLYMYVPSVRNPCACVCRPWRRYIHGEDIHMEGHTHERTRARNAHSEDIYTEETYMECAKRKHTHGGNVRTEEHTHACVPSVCILCTYPFICMSSRMYVASYVGRFVCRAGCFMCMSFCAYDPSKCISLLVC